MGDKSFNNWYRKNRPYILKNLREIVKIRSILANGTENAPFGEAIKKCLSTVTGMYKSQGMHVDQLNNTVGLADWGNGDIVLGIPTHIDVVPENGKWEVNPWDLTVKDGKLFGRGVVDDKGPVIQVLSAVKFLRDSFYKPEKKLRILFGTNEENGMKGIRHYIKYGEKIPFCFVPDSNFPVINAEKGIINFRILNRANNSVILNITGGTTRNAVPAIAVAEVSGNWNFRTAKDIKIEKIKDRWIITAEGRSAHSSEPQLGENALTTLFKYLSTYFTHPMLDFYNTYLADDYYGSKLGIDYKDKMSGELTICPGFPNRNSINLDIRYPVTADIKKIKKRISETLTEYPELELIEGGGLEPLYVPEDDAYIKILTNSYREVSGDTGSGVVYTGGGTYARIFKKAVAFGPLFPGRPETAHQPQENIPEEDFKRGILIYANSIRTIMEMSMYIK